MFGCKGQDFQQLILNLCFERSGLYIGGANIKQYQVLHFKLKKTKHLMNKWRLSLFQHVTPISRCMEFMHMEQLCIALGFYNFTKMLTFFCFFSLFRIENFYGYVYLQLTITGHTQILFEEIKKYLFCDVISCKYIISFQRKRKHRFGCKIGLS